MSAMRYLGLWILEFLFIDTRMGCGVGCCVIFDLWNRKGYVGTKLERTCWSLELSFLQPSLHSQL
jgi:hypothetical protein